MSTLAATNLKHESATGNNIVLDSSGNVAFADGSASAPSITNDGDTNTGIYFPAADNIGFATGGTIRGRWTTDGLCFGSDTAAANALDDYEEGTFTTVLSGTTAVSYANQVGRYTKIGRIVQIQFLLQTNSQTFASSGATFTISGLPFAGTFPGYQGGEGAVFMNSMSFSGYIVSAISGTTIQLRQTTSAGSSLTLTNSAVTGGIIIHGTIVYMV